MITSPEQSLPSRIADIFYTFSIPILMKFVDNLKLLYLYCLFYIKSI